MNKSPFVKSPQKCSFDGIDFDSKFERNVYLALVYNVSIKVVTRPTKVTLKSNNASIKLQQHKVDFGITLNNGLHLLVEAKGYDDSNLRYRLALMSQYDFDRYYIVVPNQETSVPNELKNRKILLPNLHTYPFYNHGIKL